MDEREKDLDEATLRREGRGTGGFMAGVLLGAVLGAGIALLLAPEAGHHTRRRLGRQLRTLRKDARQKLRRRQGLVERFRS